MRKIMVVLMVMVLLTGMMTICPMAANENVFSETFETFTEAGMPEGWVLTAGEADNVEAVDGGGVKLSGSAENETVRIRYKLKLKEQTVYEVSAQVKLLSHTAGTGFRMYYAMAEDLSSLYGSTGYYTEATDDFFKAVCQATYKWSSAGERDAFLVLEYTGAGSVEIQSAAVRNATKTGLLVNGDFEGTSGTTTGDSWTTAGASVGKTTYEGENCVSVAGTSSDYVYYTYGIPVKGGDTFRLSFDYRSDKKTPPYVYLYFADTVGANGFSTLPTTVFDPWFTKAPATTDWTEYSVTFTIPEDTTFVWFNKIGLRGRGNGANYYDNIELTSDQTRISFVDANNTPVAAVEAGKTAYTRVLYTHDEAIAAEESVSVTAIGAVYTEKDGKKQLVSVDVKTATLTEDIHTEIRPALTVPADTEGTLWAEAFVMESIKGLTPVMEKAVLE